MLAVEPIWKIKLKKNLIQKWRPFWIQKWSTEFEMYLWNLS